MHNRSHGLDTLWSAFQFAKPTRVLATPRTFAFLGAVRAERIAAGDNEEQANAAVRALIGGNVRLCRVSGAKPDIRMLNTVSTALDGRPSDGYG